MAGALLLHASIKSGVAREMLSVAALAGSSLIFSYFDQKTPFPGWAALAPVAVTGAALLALGSLLSRILLSNPAAVFVGRISYPLYLWRWPLLVFGKAYPLRTLTTPELVGLVAMAFVLAWLTYELIEKPIRSGRFASRRQGLVRRHGCHGRIRRRGPRNATPLSGRNSTFGRHARWRRARVAPSRMLSDGWRRKT
jgi:peptidoglycan/LPS O-acetylase OafA/YrhL